MATFTITIAGTDRSANVKVETVDVTVGLDRGSSSASFTMFDTAPKTGAAAIRPIERQAVAISYDGVAIFAGPISAIVTREEGRLLYYDITVQSWDQALEALSNNEIVSFVGTSGQQNTTKRLYYYDDADEIIRLIGKAPAGWALSATKVASSGKVNTYRTSTYKMAKSTSAKTGRRTHDYTQGSLAQALDKVARVGGGRWWVDASAVVNYVKPRKNLVGTNYDVEAGSPLTTAGTWTRTTNKGPAGTGDYAVVTSTAASTGAISVTGTAGKRYYAALHGYATTASNLTAQLRFYDASSNYLGGSSVLTWSTATTWQFQNVIATAPASTATARLHIISGATATEVRADNFVIVEESAPFGVADVAGSGEICPLVYVSPSDFPAPINSVYVKGKTAAGSGTRKDNFSIGYFGGTYSAVVEDAKSEDSGDVDVAANDILNARSFPEKSVGYKVRWDSTTKSLAVGQFQFENWTALGRSDVGMVAAIHYSWTSNSVCFMDVALGAPGNALGILLGKVRTAAVGVAELRGNSPTEVRPPAAAATAPQVDTTAAKPVVNTLGSFSAGVGPATVSQRASTTAPVADTLPDLPAPELPPGSLYALFPASGDTVLSRATLYRVSDDGLSWAAATSTTLTADAVAAGTTGSILIGDQIVAGTIDASTVNVSNINASNITTGTLTSIAINSGTGRFTVDASGNATANSLTIGATTTDTVGNDSTGRIAIVPSSTQGAASFQVQTDTAGSLYTEVGITSTTAGSSSSDSTVTTDSAHGFLAGQFVSFHNTGNSTWNTITASAPVQIKATPTSTTFTFRPFFSLTALASNNAGTVRAYKRLSVVAPGGTFFYQGGSTPGVVATGSLALGSNLSSLGIGTLGTIADGEIGFLSATTPRYTGGGNLYSSNGTDNVSTSGAFSVGTTLNSNNVTSTGDISFVADGGDAIIRHGTGAGVNPRLLFRNGAGTYISGLRATIGTLTHYADSGTTTLGNFTSGAISGSTITSSGNVISNGTGFLNDTPTTQTTPTTYTSGRAAIWTNTAGTAYRLDRYVAASTGEVKKNVEPTLVAPEQFYGLSLVDFEYDQAKANELFPSVSQMPTGVQHGVVYEQVKDVMPEAVFDAGTSGPGDPPGINWDQVYFAALVAIQDLNERVRQLEERLAAND